MALMGRAHSQAAAVAKGLGPPADLTVAGDRVLEGAAGEEGVVLVCQYHRLLARHPEGRVGGAIFEIPSRRHGRGPFADIAFADTGVLGHLRRGHRRGSRHHAHRGRTLTSSA